MQAVEYGGNRRVPELFKAERLKTMLDDPEVSHVEVFRLEKGMRIKVGGHIYRVFAENPSTGNLTLKYERKA